MQRDNKVVSWRKTLMTIKEMRKQHERILLLSIFVLIATIIIGVFEVFASISDNNKNSQLTSKNIEVSIPVDQMSDTDIDSEYKLNLVDNSLVINPETLVNVGDNIKTIVDVNKLNNIVHTVDDTLSLYTVDDLSDYSYITYSNEDMSKFIEITIMSKIPDAFDMSIFGLDNIDADSDKKLLISDAMIVNTDNTIQALDSIYNSGYVFVSMSGNLNILGSKNMVSSSETAESASYSEMRDFLNKIKLSLKFVEASDKNIDFLVENQKTLTVEDLDKLRKTVGHSDEDISFEKAVVDESSSEQPGEKSTDESAVSDSKSLGYGVYLSTTDSVLRILDTNDNSIYLKIYGNKASEDSVASIEDMVETVYPNVYINTNTNEIGIIISESGMYILKSAENISNELIQTIAEWAGLSSDTEKSIVDTDIQPELTSVMDESVVSAAKEQLNNNTDSENTEEQ